MRSAKGSVSGGALPASDAPGYQHRFQFCPVEMPLGLIVADTPAKHDPLQKVSDHRLCSRPQFTYRAVSWA
jgi:hypothetical protein